MRTTPGTRAPRRASAAAGMITAAIAIGMAFGVAAVAGGDPSADPPRPASPVAAASRVVEAAGPEGLTPVSGPTGAVVGYLRDQDLRRALDVGEPVVELGSGDVVFRGFEVVDLDGELVGWFLSGDNGFVSLAQVHDPEAFSAITEIWQREQAEAAEEPSPEVLELQRELEAQVQGEAGS